MTAIDLLFVAFLNDVPNDLGDRSQGQEPSAVEDFDRWGKRRRSSWLLESMLSLN